MYYGLVIKGTKKLLTFETQSNADGDFCCDTQHILSTYENDRLWLVKERRHAEKAAKEDTKWYNADYNTPSHGHDVKGKELQVVEVDIKISIKVDGEEVEVPKNLDIKGED